MVTKDQIKKQRCNKMEIKKMNEYLKLSKQMTRSDFQGLLMVEVMSGKITDSEEEDILQYVDNPKNHEVL